MIIIFVPAYDISTKANLKIAKQLIQEYNCVAIFEDEATKERLLTELEKSHIPLLAMSHGIAEEEQVDLIDADAEITDIMEIYRTLRHLWDLLRIWVPGADRPEQHPHSTSPSLPWG